MARRVCRAGGCQKTLYGRIDQKFCSSTCKSRQKSRERRAKAKPVPYVRGGGDALEGILGIPGLIEDLDSGAVQHFEAATLLKLDQSSVSRAVAMWRRLHQQEVAAAKFVLDPEIAELLAGDLDIPVRDALASANGDRFEELLGILADRFLRFEQRFFKTKRGPYLRRPFHRRWIIAILRAIYTGGRVQILSPPRHGKSELLVHFCVWLICRDPNFTIIWIATILKPTAVNMVGMVKSHLEHNTELVGRVLPADTTFRPSGRAGSEWQSATFRVAQQDRTMVKSPTMLGIGRGTSILSLDADLIILDDIENHDSTLEPASRASTRRWHETQLESRKEDTTAIAVIGSRQHPDDFYGHVLDDDQWDHIVDSAHDLECEKDPTNPSLHVDCMLFPDLRSYGWLRQKQRSAESKGLGALYEMVYLNRPRPEGQLIFSKSEIEQCYNPRRGVGLTDPQGRPWPTLPQDLLTVAGLDPSPTQYQASFCWGWSPETEKLYMIDLENRLIGGISPAFRVIKDWKGNYFLSHWVVEENGFQRAIRQDRDIRDWCALHGVYLEGHLTGTNKSDPFFGVTSMVRLFRERRIDLPFLDGEARDKTLLYVRQLLNFTDDKGRVTSRGKSDLGMASWFPMKVIRRWSSEHEAAGDAGHDGDLFPGLEAMINVPDGGWL